MHECGLEKTEISRLQAFTFDFINNRRRWIEKQNVKVYFWLFRNLMFSGKVDYHFHRQGFLNNNKQELPVINLKISFLFEISAQQSYLISFFFKSCGKISSDKSRSAANKYTLHNFLTGKLTEGHLLRLLCQYQRSLRK